MKQVVALYTVPVICIILTAVFLPAFIKSGYPETQRLTLLWKMICSTAFVVFGFYCAYSIGSGAGSRYNAMVLTGLCLGWVGDLCLTNSFFSKKVFAVVSLIGGLFFLAGHIFYIIAFLSAGKPNFVLIFIFFALTAAAVISLRFVLGINLGRLTIPVFVYALMLSFMFACALSAAIIHKTTSSLLAAAGALMFLESDLCLGLINFGGERYKTMPMRVFNLAFYYIAQLFIAASLGF